MRTCPACGAPTAPTDDFCPNCGTYLNWSTPTRPRSDHGTPEGDPAHHSAPAPGTDHRAPTPEPESQPEPGPEAAAGTDLPGGGTPEPATGHTPTTVDGAAPGGPVPEPVRCGTHRDADDATGRGSAPEEAPPRGRTAQDGPGPARGSTRPDPPSEGTGQGAPRVGTAAAAQGDVDRAHQGPAAGRPTAASAPEAAQQGDVSGADPARGGRTRAAAPQDDPAPEGTAPPQTRPGVPAENGSTARDAATPAAPRANVPAREGRGAVQEGVHPGAGGTARSGAPAGRTARAGAPGAGTVQEDTVQDGPTREGTPPGTSDPGSDPGASPGGPAPAAPAEEQRPSHAARWLSRLRPAPARATPAGRESGTEPGSTAPTGTGTPSGAEPESGTPGRPGPRTTSPAAGRAGGGPAVPSGPTGAARGPGPVAPGQAGVGPRPVAPGRAAPPPGVESPAPVLPARAVAPRPVVRPLPVGDDVTGAPCPACATPNPPERRFCRRCAAPLTPTTVAAPLPWWRTVWPFRRRTRAGSGRLVRFLVVLAVVLALCAAGFLLLPAGRHLVEDTRDKLGKAKAVTATRVQAAAELPGHPVTHSTDGLSNRYWAAPAAGTTATYTFGKPFRLVDVIITNGASTAPEEYAKQGRALRIDLEVTDRDGTTVHKKLVLSDKPGPQTFPLGISHATTVRLTLHEPAGPAEGRPLALAEVEFFQRS